jgi:hypothetical protein
MKVRKLSWGLVAAGAVGAAILWLRPQPGPAGSPEGEKAVGAAAPASLAMTGTASCSGRSCHGGIEPAKDHPVLRDEYTRWLAADRHANAYAVLFEKRAVDMAKHLGIAKAHEEPRCLACHTNPLAAGQALARLPKEIPPSQVSPLMREERLFGVGCESCHGSAEKWLGPHTEAAWQKMSAEKKWTDYGMVPVHDPLVLAKQCAGCHVGAAAAGTGVLRDVNHDLIGAGHPRLHFEFSTFLANLPPHWNTAAKRERRSEAEKWAAGQAACAEAALALLEDRATDRTAPWPEFAEYDCFACHHDLKGKSWRQSKANYGKRMPGALPWGTWYFSMPLDLAGPKGAPELEKLVQLMQVPYPEKEKVRHEAKAALTWAEGWAKAPGLEKRLPKMLADFTAGKEARAGLSWDAAEQLYLASFALNPAFADDALSNARAFPPGFDSPKGFTPETFLKELRARLGKKGK